MHPGSEESNVAAPPCFVQEPKQQASQPAANRGVAVPAGKLKDTTAGVARPGAVGNMHVLGDIGNVVHATARSSMARSSYWPGRDQSSNHQEVQRSTLEEGPGRSIHERRRTDS